MDEAGQKNVIIRSIKILGRQSNFFSITYEGKKDFFEGIPTVSLGLHTTLDFDDKAAFKIFLKQHSLPHAEGKGFSTARAAVSYAKALGYPLVVKPRYGSLSKHTTCNISDSAHLEAAITIAKKFRHSFIVERFLAGTDYRITLLNGEILA